MKRGLGILLMVIGALVMAVAMMMDTTVSFGGQSARVVGTTYGTEELPEVPAQRVHNIGLIQAQQNHLILGGVIAIAGLLVALLGGGTPKVAQADQINSPADDLKAFGIERVGEKWLYKGQEFNSYEAAVLFARR